MPLSPLTCSSHVPHFCQWNYNPPRYPDSHLSIPTRPPPPSNPSSSPGACSSAVDPKPGSPQGQQGPRAGWIGTGQWRMGRHVPHLDRTAATQLPLLQLTGAFSEHGPDLSIFKDSLYIWIYVKFPYCLNVGNYLHFLKSLCALNKTRLFVTSGLQPLSHYSSFPFPMPLSQHVRTPLLDRGTTSSGSPWATFSIFPLLVSAPLHQCWAFQVYRG